MLKSCTLIVALSFTVTVVRQVTIWLLLFVGARWCLELRGRFTHNPAVRCHSLSKLCQFLLEPQRHSLQGHSDHRLTRAYD